MLVGSVAQTLATRLLEQRRQQAAVGFCPDDHAFTLAFSPALTASIVDELARNTLHLMMPILDELAEARVMLATVAEMDDAKSWKPQHALDAMARIRGWLATRIDLRLT